MKTPLLIFVKTPSNKNSLIALLAAIEKNPSLKSVQIKLVDDMTKIEEKGRPIIVAFSFMTPAVFGVKRQISNFRRRLKGEEDKGIIFIAGGPHPSGDPYETLKMGFDYSFVGEAEESLSKFLLDWEKDKLPDQPVIKSKPVDIRKYPAVSPKFNLFGPIEISRGCPFGCRFCQTTYFFGQLRHRTIEQIIWATQEIAKNGYPKDIRFVTPNLLAYGSEDGFKPNLHVLEKMLREVKKVKGVSRVFAGTFPSEIRPEQVTPEALKIIRKYCDNDNLIIGAQTGSERMLKLCHRGHTVQDVYRAVELSLEAGFEVNVDFIFGMPGETAEDEEKTKKMILNLVKKPSVRIHGHFFLSLPGTPWEKEKPQAISQKFRDFLLDLRRKGKEYGDWQKQEVIALPQ